MAGNRKHHRGQPTRRNSTSGSPSTNYEGNDPNGKNSNGEDPDATSDFNKVLQEVEGSFQVTWKEILVALVGVFLLALFSICVGIAAGMTISIHYYENQSPMVRTGRLDAVSSSGTNNHHTNNYEPAAITAATGLYGGNSGYQRVTILDPMIVSSNVMKNKDSENGGNLDLGKVITTTASGQLNVLMVVEETPPLVDSSSANEGGEADYYGSSTMNGSSAPHGDDSASTATDGTTDTQPGRSREQNQKHFNDDNNNNSNPRRNLQHPTNNIGQDPNNHAKEYDYRSSNSHYRQIAARPRAHVEVRDSKIRPTLCSDGLTYGYDTWHTFKAAVQEANAISAERFMRWNEFFASQSGVGSMTGPYTFTSFLDDSLYYEEDVVFTICPGAILKARRGPIFLNAENVLIECDGGCTIDVGGTHLAFGPHARNVLVRGITFKSARTSSLTFFHDGAEASFEECFWIGNAGINGKYGAVADVNSTSTVNFYRCEISQGKKGYGSMPPGFASSLSIRA